MMMGGRLEVKTEDDIFKVALCFFRFVNTGATA